MTDSTEGKRNENQIKSSKVFAEDIHSSSSSAAYSTMTSDSQNLYTWEVKRFNQSHLDKYESDVADFNALKVKIAIQFDQQDDATCVLYFSDMQDNLEIKYQLDLTNWKEGHCNSSAKNSFYSNPKMNTYNSNYFGNRKENDKEGTNTITISMKLNRSDFEDRSSGWTKNDTLRMTIKVHYAHVADISGENSKKETGYVGLKNQGATCYMNSMLQALYHLPAFRRIVYNMPTTGVEDETKSIPLNLQRLFCRMQFSEHPCSTKMLTQSFGWGDIETIMQHDVQEFCRVLIDNLEMKMKDNDSLATAIPDLFKGQYRSFVRCKNVQFESSRIEDFYDLTLQVKKCPTLEDSFQKYIEKEQLVDENQYQAEGFGLQDAEMGVEFISLPSVLQLHLGRLEYNYETDQMMKINDRFEFQEEIDLAPYLAKDADRSKSTIYELYGVLVHMGGIYCGHYYAFLRTSTDPQWYQFDDNCVTKADSKEAIKDNFGEKVVKKYQRYNGYSYSNGYNGYNYNYNYGGNSGYGGNYSGGASKSYSAYMLFYIRKEDAPNIMSKIQDASVPRHLIDYVEEISKQKELKKARKKAESSIINITILTEDDLATNCQMDVIGFDPKKKTEPLKIDKKSTTEELYHQISKHLNVAVNEIRIWSTVTSKIPKKVMEMSENDHVIDHVSHYYNSLTVFVQKILPGEELGIPNGGIVIFLKFYFPSSRSPIQYIGTMTVNERDIVGSIVHHVNDRIGFPESTKLDVFQENLNKTVTQKMLTDSFDKLSINNGSILILQVDPNELQPSLDDIRIKLRDPLPLPPDPSPKSDENDEKSRESSSENKDSCEIETFEPVNVVKMSDLDDSAPLKTVHKYYTIKYMSEIVELFDYDAYSADPTNENNRKPIVALEYPTTISLICLKNLICKATKREYDSEKDSVILYRKMHDSKTPEKKPIENHQTNCFNLFQYQRSNEKRHGLFFYVNYGVSENKLQTMKNYLIDVSIDGILIKYSKNIFAKKDSTCFEIVNQLSAQFSDEDREIIESQKEYLRFFQMQDHKYFKPFKRDDVPIMQDSSNTLRVDVIPENQRELKNDEFLMPITFLTKDGMKQKVIGVGHPFFMVVKTGETFKDIKPRILQNVPEYNENKFEIRVRTHNNSEAKYIREELKDDCVISDKYCENSRIYLYTKKNKASHYDQAVKIFN